MDSTLKKRLIGATVLIALAVIFVPMLVQEPAPDAGVGEVPLAIPGEPAPEQTRELPLQLPTTGARDAPLDAVDDTSQVVSVDADAEPRADALAGHEPATPNAAEAGPANATSQAPAQPAAPPAAEPSKPSDAPTRASASKPTPAASETAAKPSAAPAKPAATPPPAPAATPIDAGSGGYVVNLGAYANIANVDKLAAELRAAGLALERTPLQIAGKPAVRLRLGPYARRSEAEQARLKALAVRHDLPATVLALDAPPAASAASKAATPDVGYVVQLGAFRDAADADALLARLRQAGFTGLRDSVPGASGPLFRVRAGPTVSRAEADRLRAAIADKLHVEGIVLGHP